MADDILKEFNNNPSDFLNQNIIVNNNNNFNINWQHLNSLIKTKLISNIPPGLANVGQTCFHNSVTQLIYRVQELIPFIINPKITNQYRDFIQYYNYVKIGTKFNPVGNKEENIYVRQIKQKPNEIKYFIQLLNLMKNSPDKNYLTKDELENLVISQICQIIPTYQRAQQEDAGSFLQFILNSFNIECIADQLEPKMNILKKDLCTTDNKILRKFPNNDPRDFMVFKEYKYDCETDLTENNLTQNLND